MIFKLIIILTAFCSGCRAFKPELKAIRKIDENKPKTIIQPAIPDESDKQKPEVKHVETLTVLYIKINEVDVPTLSFKKNDPNTYVKYKACNSENNCIRGEAYKDLHAIRNFPLGMVTVSFQTCKIKSDLSQEENCSIIKSFTTNYRPETPNDSPLSQLLGEQATLEEQMGEQARKIKSISTHLGSIIDRCKDPVFKQKVGEKERELIKKIALMDLEDIIDALSIAGNVGELWELSKLEDERKKAEEKEKDLAAAQQQATKIATMNFLNGILLAGAAIGTYNAVESVIHWQYFWHQQRNLFNDKGKKFRLKRIKNSPYFHIEEFPDQKFIEDPFTLEKYLVDPGNNKETKEIKLHSGNDKQIRLIKIDEKKYKYTLEGLILKKSDSKLYLPNRIKKDGILSFGEELEIKKGPTGEFRFHPSKDDKNDFRYRKARKDYFSELSEFRHPHDPLKSWGKTSRFYSGSFQTISVLGAVATLLISGIFFEEGFHLKDTEYTRPCEDIIANLHKYNEEFKKSYAIYTRLLQIKIEIYMII
ncbi:MAG: hypothetical protein AB8G05_12410 [Oligoflexales bacterium]